MKTLLFIVVCLLTSLTSLYAQNAKLDAKGNYVYVPATVDTTQLKSTGKTYTDAKGEVYPVYISDKNKLFIVKTTKKTGAKHKSYLKL